MIESGSDRDDRAVRRRNIVGFMVWGLSLLGLESRVSSAQVPGYPMSVEQQVLAQESKKHEKVLDRRISLTIQNESLREAIGLAASQAKLRVTFYGGDTALSKRVSLSVKNTPVLDVIDRLIRGSNLRATLGPDGEKLIITESRDTVRATTPQQETNSTIAGTVTDSATGAPIVGVTIAITGTPFKTITDRDGKFSFTNVPLGRHSVVFKMLGYASTLREATVAASASVKLTVVLKQTASMLSGVVTTATGTQRKIEVGHDIVTLNVDSIMQVAPISTMTDLLESRVPGMSIQRTSGTPGDPSRIRLRGTGSINQNNDPIIVIDGVRMYSEQSDGSNRIAGSQTSYPTPSPLDLIDPSMVEKVEVLKGPSASAMYGSDAANGVIVVTTKRGKPGPPQVAVMVESGRTHIPGKWPESLWRWATPLYGGLPYVCIGFCGDARVDSVVPFSALNTPYLTPLGTGETFNASADMSGGTQTIRYSFGVSTRRERGVLKLPAIEVDRYQKFQEEPPPGWMRDPDLMDRKSAQAQMDVTVSPKTTLSVRTVLSQSSQRRTSMSSSTNSAISQLQRLWVDLSQLDERPLLGNPYERVQVNTLNLTNSMDIRLTPWSWLPLRSTLGWSTMNRQSELQIPYGLLMGTDSAGAWRGENQVTSTISGNLLSTLDVFPRTTVSLGIDLSQTRRGNQQGALFGWSPGIEDPSSGTQSTRTTFSRSSSQNTSFGWFFEPKLNVSSRFFVIPGFRIDQSGVSGNNAKLLSLPKLNLSWMVSDESFFPKGAMIQELRVRTSFGVAGVRPKPTEKLRLYNREDIKPFSGVEPFYGLLLRLDNLGNTRLRPERGTEWEGGFDVDLWDGRVQLQSTLFRKRRIDAIVDDNYAASIDGGGKRAVNVGDIRNMGTELGLQVRLLDRREVSFTVNSTFSQMRSRVTRLSADGAHINLSGIRYVVGYPMEGRWAVPVLGYDDLDRNGWIGANEIALGSSEIYVGSTEPRFQAALFPNLSLLGGRININAGLSYTAGQMQLLDPNMTVSDRAEWLIPAHVRNQVEGAFDRQVAWVAYDKCGSRAECYITPIGYVQTVDVLRLQSMSIRFSLGGKIVKMLNATRASISVQGSNLGLWTNYLGVDPNVNGSAENRGLTDSGQLPSPRLLQVRCSLGF